MKIFDSHTHLNDDQLWSSHEFYMNHAEKLGVVKTMQVGSNLDFNKKAIELSERFDGAFAAIGWHPSDVNEFDAQSEKWLINNLKNEKVKAIGEIGLDYYMSIDNKELQKSVFTRQLDIAVNYKMPIIIHTREALEDTYDILANSNINDSKVVIHNFNSNVEWLAKFLDLGCYASFSGVASFKKTKEVHEAVRKIPLDRIMLETDAPYLTPEPLRGSINEPAYALYVLEALARYIDVNPEKLAKITYDNTCAFYGIK